MDVLALVGVAQRRAQVSGRQQPSPPRDLAMSDSHNEPLRGLLDVASNFHVVINDVSNSVELCSKTSMQAFSDTYMLAALRAQQFLAKPIPEDQSQPELPPNKRQGNGQPREDRRESQATTIPGSCTNTASLQSSYDEPERRALELAQMRKQYRKNKRMEEHVREKYVGPSAWKPMSKAEEFNKLVHDAKRAGAREARDKREQDCLKKANEAFTNRNLHPRDFDVQLMSVKRGFESRDFFRGVYVRDQEQI